MLFISPNNEYPRHIGDLQIEHPNWKEGDALPPGWQIVEYATELPERGENEIVYEIKPTIINGKLTQTFAVRPMTDEEIERKNAPASARQKLIALGLTEAEVQASLEACDKLLLWQTKQQA